MRNDPRQDVHLVAWSGGLDSTWLVWELCRQGLTVCADHYHQTGLTQRRQRLANAQLAAVQAIAPQLELCGLTCRGVHPYERESPHDIVFVTEITIDDTVHGLAAWPNIFYLGVRTDEQSKAQLGRQRKVNELWDLMAPAWSKVHCPAIGIDRKEMWDQLPDDIRRQTWSCRNPRWRNERFYVCEHCRPCKELIAAGVPVQRRLTV